MTSISFFQNPIILASKKLSFVRFLLLPYILYTLYTKDTLLFQWHLILINTTPLYFPLIIDRIRLITIIIVIFISFNVIKFGSAYIKHDVSLSWLVNIIIIFILSINTLIFIPHTLFLLIGWDGLGLSRFMLVIYYQNKPSLSAGILTALTNRIGDIILLFSIIILINSNQWLSFIVWDNNYKLIIRTCIILAAFTKRAQFPFSAWLPAAIAAPTPVSALVHSSTLVTAGIFLQIRFYNLLFCRTYINSLVIFISVLTILRAGISATLENDLKKIIALSTLRQLRVIIFSLGIGLPILALFHIITHGIFKALIFICAGIFITLHSHNQDLRIVSKLNIQIPVTSSSFIIANISLCAMPFIAGFYSKDQILEILLRTPINTASVLLTLTATGITIAYSSRLVMLCLWTNNNFTPISKFHDEDQAILNPIINLTVAALFRGAIINWLFLPLFPLIIIPSDIKLILYITTALSLLFSLSANSISSTTHTSSIPQIFLIEIPMSMWFITPLRTQYLVSILKFSHNFLKTLDQGWFDLLSGQSAHKILISSSKILQTSQAQKLNLFSHLVLYFIVPLLLVL